MDTTQESLEESFVVKTPRRNPRPIIPSDSEEEDYDQEVSSPVVEDSFSDGDDIEESINLQYDKNTDIVESTDDESPFAGSQNISEDDESPGAGSQNVSGVDVIESTDEENSVLKSPFNSKTLSKPWTANDPSTSTRIKKELQPEKNISNDHEYYLTENEEQSKEATSLMCVSESQSVVELSSDDEIGPQEFKQLSIKSFLSSTLKENDNIQPSTKAVPQENAGSRNVVGVQEYQSQVKNISMLREELTRAENTIRIVKIQSLPDKGKSLIQKKEALQAMLKKEQDQLANMVVDANKVPSKIQDKVAVAWDEIEAGVDAVGPRTFGKKGINRFNTEKNLAVETLDHLHKSLGTCPTENDLAEDPKRLKVPLMLHQKRALAWLLWRETQKPSGGLLADDMGLGKTLTMISLIMASKELDVHDDDDAEKENYRDKYPGGTLVVCPASLINQWSGEIESKTKRGTLSVEIYHGSKRETKPKRLAEHDVVITTYGLIPKESVKTGSLFRVRWRRIILDESHQIRNHKSQTSEAVFRLSGKSRWALTGTPVHNKELDMYAVLKFLRCAPFDDLQVWKRWIGDKTTGGAMRLHAVISTLMLRRTKAELMEKGSLKSLPDRTWDLISVTLDKDEMDVYQKILIFSRTLFAQFLHQRAEKNQDAMDIRFTAAPPDPNGEYFKMRNRLLKMNRVREVSQHEILVLLLRLRQICCHASLIKQMLHGDEDLGVAEDCEESEELNLLDQLNKLDLNADDEFHPNEGLAEENVGLKEASKGFLNPSNPVFKSERASSKIRALINLLKERVSANDKAIIVSQWTSLLDLIAIHLKDEGVTFDSLTGKTPTHKRMAIVDNFNDQNTHVKVLLLSLTAGGVGLNLVGANHLFLLDLHWNPQLESQAQDRIYRMGQTKPIFVYKFMAVDTIEQRIKALQEHKLEIANSMLGGSKRVIENKLSLQDLKMLFEFK